MLKIARKDSIFEGWHTMTINVASAPSVSASSATANARPAQNDPVKIANEIIAQARADGGAAGLKLETVEVALDTLAQSNAALADQVRSAVLQSLAPVQQGELARISDGRMVSLGNGQYTNFRNNGIS
jgi:hypothetical protein